MGEWLRFDQLKHQLLMLLIICVFNQKFEVCWSLNDEGLALLKLREKVENDPFGALSDWNDKSREVNPCSWSGVECSDGNVVILNLKDLRLKGTLAPELGSMYHIKSIILRNNLFSGIIPEEIGELKELEVLDLGDNNFSGPLPSNLRNNLSLSILLLDNNELLGGLSPEVNELQSFSEAQVDEDQLSNIARHLSCYGRDSGQNRDSLHRKLLQDLAKEDTGLPRDPSRNKKTQPPPQGSAPVPSPTPSPSPSPSPSPESSTVPSSPNISVPSTPPSPTNTTSPSTQGNSSHNSKRILYRVIGGFVALLFAAIGMFVCRINKVATVKPWTTGLSGQLQKAFVTGVPKLKRTELETACEDFSNVIGTSLIGTMYKGTLSNGVEIAVTSVAAVSAKDWSKSLEAQFRKKIDRLSKVNHKNFVNLLGYCAEEEPFTRMMVFEYAPNGTLFEHLHIKEAEHLDWGMRMRIAMGMAYCLDYMHQLSPPVAHKNFTSSSVSLTEDYAAKIFDFGFWNEVDVGDKESSSEALPNIHSAVDTESNVYSFGVILYEMITSRLPYAVGSSSVKDWASDYLKNPHKEMVDPTLQSFNEEQLEKVGELIKLCVNPDPEQRPSMKEVTIRLGEITGIEPQGATPKFSPLWWAELEVMSVEAP